MRITRFVYAASLLFSVQAQAQINIERFRPDGEQVGLSGQTNFSLSSRTGNVEIVELGASVRVDYLTSHARTLLLGRGDLGWQGGERFANEALLHLRHERRLAPSVRFEGFSQINYDKSRLLLFRGLAGGGPRLRLIQAERARVWFGAAYMFEYEHLDLDDAAVHPNETSSHRLSSYLSTSIGLGRDATLVSTVYVQPRIDDLEDARVLGELGVSAELFSPVSLSVSFRLRYDGDPPDDVRELDTTLGSGLSISF